MPRIYVDLSNFQQIGTSCRSVSNSVSKIQSDFEHTVKHLDWDVHYESDINNTAKQLSKKLDKFSTTLKKYQEFVNNANKQYIELDKYKKSKFDNLFKKFWKDYGWTGLLAGSNYIITIFKFIKDLKNCKTWNDFIAHGYKIMDFFSDVVITFGNYMKIGNAVGVKKSITWWAKKITGLKSLGRVSSAKKINTRFIHNFTNKTSPFNANIKKTVGDIIGKNGVGKAFAFWGTAVINGIANYNNNKMEQAESGGKMSDQRVITETVVETIIDTGLTTFGGIVVGAAISAAFPVIASYGIVSIALSGAIMSMINVGVESVTHKTVTEWISDGLIDINESIGNGCSGIMKPSSAVAGWVNKTQ